MIFSDISWKTFVIGIMVLLIIYYLVVGIKYYSKEIRLFLSEEKVKKPKKTSNQEHPDQEYPDQEAAFEDVAQLFDQAAELTKRIKIAIKIALSREYSQEQLTLSIQTLIEDFPELRQRAIRRAINNQIISETEKTTVYHFSEDAVSELWKG